MSGKKSFFSLSPLPLSSSSALHNVNIGPFPADRGRGVNGADLRLGNAHLLGEKRGGGNKFLLL